ncbi:MAG: DUF3810 family protein [Bacilli bacterium]|jgi:hypothetical protein
MDEKVKLKKAIFAKIYFLIALVLLFGILILIRSFEASAEFWTRTFYRFMQSVFGPVVSIIPFSLAEVFFILFGCAIMFLLIFIIIDLAKKRGLSSLNKALALVVVITSTVAFYYSTAGVAYGRAPVEIPQYNQAVENTEYVDIVEYFIDDFNDAASQLTFNEEGSVVKPYTINEISELLRVEYADLNSNYFTAYTSRVKPMFLSFLFREFNITGLSFAPTTEPNINYLTPDSQIASTMAHELAHSKGVVREQDANLVAAYLLLNSNDAYLRYCGYFTTLYSLISLSNYVGDDEKYAELYNSLALEIRNDYKYSSHYWSQFNLLDDLATWFNNLYLMLVGNEGVSSYVDNPDTGEYEDPETGDTIVYISEFSPYQKLYFHFYYN